MKTLLKFQTIFSFILRTIDKSIVLRMNENIVKISNKVQDKVKTTVENMTGMEVAGVNVNISNVLSN